MNVGGRSVTANTFFLYYLRVADLMGITFPYPRENIIASNYILADTQAFLSKRHRQQNNEILIRHSPGIVICPLSSRQVKYLKLDVDDACISF